MLTMRALRRRKDDRAAERHPQDDDIAKASEQASKKEEQPDQERKGRRWQEGFGHRPEFTTGAQRETAFPCVSLSCLSANSLLDWPDWPKAATFTKSPKNKKRAEEPAPCFGTLKITLRPFRADRK